MSKKTEYEVTLRFGGTTHKGNRKVPLVAAQAKVAGKMVGAAAETEAEALAVLRTKIEDAEALEAMKAEYPKTVLVTV